MARKTAIDPALTEAIDDFIAISEAKYEIAKDIYDTQDKLTQEVIDHIVTTLQTYASGTAQVKVGREKQTIQISDEHRDYNLLYLAIEIVKDLAFMDIKVANFEFAPGLCASCGSEL